MEKKLLLITAALLAGMSLASAQGQQSQLQLSQVQRSEQRQTQGAGGVALTNEQRTKIRQTVFAKSDIPRVDPNKIDFAFVAGATVPTYFPVAQVPEALAEIHPAWRGDMYLVAGDDIVVMDHSRRVVATLPGETTTGQGNPSPQRSTAPNASGSASMPRNK